MSDDNSNENVVPNAMLGWLIAPLAVLVALVADKLIGFGLEFGKDELIPFVAIIVAAALGIAPRVLRENKLIDVSSQFFSLATLIVALLAAQGAAIFADSNVIGLLFFVTMFGGHILDTHGRHEWNTVLIFSMVGVLIGFAQAGDFFTNHTAIFTLESVNSNGEPITQDYERLDAWREAIGFIFFNSWIAMTVMGMLAATLTRGLFSPATDKGWFGYIKSNDTKWNRSTLPLQVGLAVWAFAHFAVIAYFNSLGDMDILNIWSEEGYHGYIGFWPAALTGAIALICAWMCAERWYTRAMMVGSMWTLYIVASLYETGHWTSEYFQGTWAVWIWFGITFFIGVLIYWFSTHDDYGGWMIREIHQPSQAKVFWSNHWAGILTCLAFIVALTIRIQWYVIPSLNSAAIGGMDLTGGSDPWYMKRVVDYIIAEHAHLVFDADRNYPVGGINPRPPLFTWSIALAGMAIAPLLGATSAEASWWAMLALPAIYGALTIFPMAGIARDNFGKGAGVLAAWLIAFMPTHVQKSTWAMADHDSFVLLFFTAAFMFYLRAVKAGGDERLMRNTNASFMGMVNALSTVYHQRRRASLNAIAAGVCFAIVALGWKGFVYGPAIIFLAYFVQVAMNMFRRKDSTILSALNIFMLGTIFIMVIPFYAHPQLNLVLNSTGLQPMLFIAGFTIAISWITTGFRDKPWLLVLGSLVAGGAGFLGLLYLLQLLDISNAWNVLTTGSGYFTKNKIFGTIAEASAPSRGQLFASFGPFIFVIAIVMGIIAIWDGLFKKNQNRLILGMWVIIAAYMAWSAGRFLFNAAPAMAVMGSWGLVTLWRASGAGNMAKNWRRMGIRTPGERITSARKAVWRAPQFSAIGLVLLMLVSQHAAYGIDAAMPSSSNHEAEMDETIYNIVPDILRWNQLGFSLFDDKTYESGESQWYLGSFGSGFNDQGWNLAYDWLSEQDTDQPYSDRPAFVSWWDYGFQALETGDHPSVSDNFQSGIPATGNMLLARNQDDVVSMFIWRLSEADLAYNQADTDFREHTSSFNSTLLKHLPTDAHFDEFTKIQTDLTADYVESLSFAVIESNNDPQGASERSAVLAQGFELNQGLIDDETMLYKVYVDQKVLPCTDSNDEEDCVGDAYNDEEKARNVFKTEVRAYDKDTEFNTTHYITGDYWYTADLVEEFDSVSTGIHRKNAGLALITQLLSSSLNSSQLHDLYADLMNNAVYSVQDYEGAPGETITRDHEIRYLAIDNRLYPRAGRYSDEYTGGNPTGIFTAPTILSGQDFSTFMVETYETIQGTIEQEMTRDEYNERMRDDIILQQSGSEQEPMQLVDVRIDHTAEFFDTMLARTYVGYGAPQLGFTSTEQPGQHFGQSGTPNSIMSNAVPLPGAMMNHFVIANWYDAEDVDQSIGQSNTLVKILKYYPGTEVCGSVKMSDNGESLPNVRMLIERDAFSGEGPEDLDDDTYWIPIGYTDSDESGNWCYTVPAGKIRVSAFAGVYDDIAAKDVFRSGEYTSGLNDFTVDTNTDRDVNLITALLGHVSNMTWLGETAWNITGEQADRLAPFDGNFDIEVDSSGVSGTVTWSGDDSFAGEPIEDTTFILRNIWSMTDNYTVTTTSGSFSSDEFRIVGPGTGQAVFAENGTFNTQGAIGLVSGFTGNYTRFIADDRTYTTNGTWSGTGSIVANWIDYDAPACDIEENESVMPIYVDEDGENQTHTACLTNEENGNTYLFQGEINASGRMTAENTVRLVKYLDDQTFEGEGLFEGTGTANGTGLFSGIGEFSGDMVQPGSFYMSGLMPGTYNMVAQFPNGKEVLLPDPVVIELIPVLNMEMTLGGSIFEDALFYDLLDDNGLPVPIANGTIELVDNGLPDAQPVLIPTNETGNFSYGPIAKGDYTWRVDVDNDGWYEREENFSVLDDPTNITLGFSLPTKRDVTLTLDAGDSGLEMDGRTITFTNTLSTDLNDYSVTAISENGTVFAELDMGDWIISDQNDESYILWAELEVRDVDINMSGTYAVSVWYNGTIYAPPIDVQNEYSSLDSIPQDILDNHRANGVTIQARSGGIMFSDVSSLENSSTSEFEKGTFSIRIPAGRVFHITAEHFVDSGTVTVGELVNDAIDLDGEVDLFLVQSSLVRGSVYLREYSENGTLWGSGVPGSEDVEVIATSEDGLERRYQLTDVGDFVSNLQDGNWTFTVSNELMNVEPVTINASVEEIVSLVADPAPVSLNIRVFLDTNEDGVWENGTFIQPDIVFEPQGDFGVQLNVTSDDYNLTSGELLVDLEVGQYLLKIVEDDPHDENASDYRLRPTSLPGLDLGLSESGDPIEIMMEPYYLVTGSINQENGYSMNNSTVYFTLMDDTTGSSITPVTTNGTGMFATYLSQGDWLVQISPYTSDSNVTEIYRGSLTVDADSSTRTNMTAWRTLTAMVVNIHLMQDLIGTDLALTSITATNLDGLGNQSLGPSDSTGMISELLMPGAWTLSANRTESMEKWYYPAGLTNSTDNGSIVNGTWEVGNLSLTKTVQVSGKVYWDLDADERPDSGEGVENVTVTFIGGTVNETMLTDESGNWEIWVPIRENYSLNVSKLGFASVSFTDNWTLNETNYSSEYYRVNDSHESRDIIITAGKVEVSGQVTVEVETDRVTSQSLDGATVMLYPSIGLERDAISLTPSYENGTLSWNTTVDPGKWIVVVTASDSTDNGGGVAIGQINATVQEGATLDLVMEFGGHILITTEWNTFDLIPKHAGEVTGDAVEVEIDLGDGLVWLQTVDSATGELDLILPIGSVDFDSEFSTIQHDMLLEMDYFAGVNVDNGDGLDEKKMLFNQRPNSDLVSSISDTTVVNALTDFEMVGDVPKYDMTAIEGQDNDYGVIRFTMDLDYEGVEVTDKFTLSGGLSPSQDSTLWTVEFENGVWAEDDEDIDDMPDDVEIGDVKWSTDIDVTFGVGVNNSDSLQVLSNSVNVRITLPLQDEAYTLSNDVGHSVNLRLVPLQGSPHERTVRVFVPQQYNISLSDVPESVGIADGGEQLVTFSVDNLGNGDDIVLVQPELTEDCVEAGWSVRDSYSNLTVPPYDSRTQSFTVTSAVNSTISECKLTVTAESSGDFDIQEGEIEMIISVASLSFVEENIEPFVQNAAAFKPGEIKVPIRNDGYLEASDVIVYIEGQNGTATEFTAQDTISVPANGIAYAEFTYEEFDSSTHYFEIRMEPIGTPTDSTDEDHKLKFTISFSNIAEEEESSGVGIVIVILGILVLFGGFKAARRGSSSRF